MMDFGIMFFPNQSCEPTNDKYRLLIEAAKFADKHGFCSVWTPERHFHEFGGIFPNPSVISAALAMITRRIHIRAGSVISPLHNPIRIAEEWSVVDNLSNGRVGISFGSGWNVDDFIFFPDRYQNRWAVMYQQIETLQKLWKGANVTYKNSFDKDVKVTIYPRPIQKELPIWITSSGNVETFVSAGAIGANLLTHFISQDIKALAGKIQCYRGALKQNGFAKDHGKVSLMLHTFLGPDAEATRAKVRDPFRKYLRSAVFLESKAAQGGGVISGGHKISSHEIPTNVVEELLDITLERYIDNFALIGTPDSCRPLLNQLKDIEVDEIACLIDFGVDTIGEIIESLGHLNALRESFS